MRYWATSTGILLFCVLGNCPTFGQPNAPKQPNRIDYFGSIEGLVVDEQDKPVAGITVEAFGGSRKCTATTNSGGQFKLVPKNSSEDELRVFSAIRLIEARHPDNRMGAAQRMDDAFWAQRPVRIQLAPPRKLTVVVVDKDAQPLAGIATVALVHPGVPIASGFTGADGHWAVNLPAGMKEYVLAALKAGAGLAYARGNPQADPESAQLTLPGSKTISVRVVDSSNRPIADDVVYIVSLATSQQHRFFRFEGGIWMSARSTTNKDGIAVFDWIPVDIPRNQYIAFGVKGNAQHKDTYKTFPPDKQEVEIRVLDK